MGERADVLATLTGWIDRLNRSSGRSRLPRSPDARKPLGNGAYAYYDYDTPNELTDWLSGETSMEPDRTTASHPADSVAWAGSRRGRLKINGLTPYGHKE